MTTSRGGWPNWTWPKGRWIYQICCQWTDFQGCRNEGFCMLSYLDGCTGRLQWKEQIETSFVPYSVPFLLLSGETLFLVKWTLQAQGYERSECYQERSSKGLCASEGDNMQVLPLLPWQSDHWQQIRQLHRGSSLWNDLGKYRWGLGIFMVNFEQVSLRERDIF